MGFRQLWILRQVETEHTRAVRSKVVDVDVDALSQ